MLILKTVYGEIVSILKGLQCMLDIHHQYSNTQTIISRQGPVGPPTKAMQFSGNVYTYIFVVRCQLVSTEKVKHLL